MSNTDPKATQKQPYIGSVRFFKHVILSTIALLILVPTTLCIILAVQNHNMHHHLYGNEPKEQSSFFGFTFGGSSSQEEDGAVDLPAPETETPAWQALYPELYAQPAERSSVHDEHAVYLTFDDGPSACTPQVLEILARYDIKATFFVVGKTDAQSQQWMRDIVEAGHSIGVHSFSHEYTKIYASVEAYLEDFEKMYQLVLDATGVAPQIFRFPGGSINAYNAATYQEIIAEMVRRGFVYFDWNVSSGDAASGHTPAANLTLNALSKIDSLRRAIVLMHDSSAKATTIAALPAIIEGYQNAGFHFASLSPEVKPIIFSYQS